MSTAQVLIGTRLVEVPEGAGFVSHAGETYGQAIENRDCRGVLKSALRSIRIAKKRGHGPIEFIEQGRRRGNQVLDAFGLTVREAYAILHGVEPRTDSGSAQTPSDALSEPASEPERASDRQDDSEGGEEPPPAPRPQDAPSAGDDGWTAYPPILYVEDLARLFRLSEGATRRQLAAGRFGRRFRIGKRWAVDRRALREHLARIAEDPARPARPSGDGVAKYERLLRRRKRRR